MKNIKMIVTDLDNTLLRKNKSISDYTESVLKKCHENGYLLVYATARPERATRKWQLDNFSTYIISNNGATISFNGKEIQNISISESTKHNLIKRFIADNDVTSICVETGLSLYTNDKNYLNWESVGFDTGWNPVYHDFITPITEKTCKFSVECKNPEIIIKILREYPEVKFYHNSGEVWYQIMDSTTSKFNAITYLSNQTGVKLQDIIAFGDDFNDVEMLQKCGVGVAVENAVINAKEAANFICDTNDDDGVSKWIEQNLLT